MKLLAIDPSLTATGLCGVDGKSWSWKPDCVGAERLSWYRACFTALFSDERTRPDIALIEGYAYGRPNQAHQVGELGGIIRLTAYRCEIPLVVIPPATLKKYATGKGNAKKEEVLVAAVLRSGRELTNDEADAWWLRQIGLSHYDPTDLELVQMPKTNTDALSKVEWA